MSDLHIFLLGSAATLSLVVALFFVRSWRITGDRFFALFAVAFSMMATNWALAASIVPDNESRHWIYLLRLGAFVTILGAIIDKNRASRS